MQESMTRIGVGLFVTVLLGGSLVLFDALAGGSDDAPGVHHAALHLR